MRRFVIQGAAMDILQNGQELWNAISGIAIAVLGALVGKLWQNARAFEDQALADTNAAIAELKRQLAELASKAK
jgi:hypothetical protein